MQSWNLQSYRRVVAATLLTGALLAQTAVAGCPPGYRSKAGHCIPGPAQTHRPVAIKSNVHAPLAVSPVHASKPHSHGHASSVTSVHATAMHPSGPKTAHSSHSGRHSVPTPAGSSSGYDLRAQHEAKSAHGIIFVGGKQSLNPQPIPPGKTALNPQPIPPGHSLQKPPQPGAPVQQAISH